MTVGSTTPLSVLAAAALSMSLAGPSAAGAQEPAEPAPKIDLRVLYLGSSEDSEHSRVAAAVRARRFAAFETFLRTRFVAAEGLDRDDFAPGDEEGFDVVVLDWGQQDIDIQGMADLVSPLGPREEWTLPTVLIGSAGLLMAGPWELPGSWG